MGIGEGCDEETREGVRGRGWEGKKKRKNGGSTRE